MNVQEAIKVLNTLPNVPTDYSTLPQELKQVLKDINEHEQGIGHNKSTHHKWEKRSSHKFRR